MVTVTVGQGEMLWETYIDETDGLTVAHTVRVYVPSSAPVGVPETVPLVRVCRRGNARLKGGNKGKGGDENVAPMKRKARE